VAEPADRTLCCFAASWSWRRSRRPHQRSRRDGRSCLAVAGL